MSIPTEPIGSIPRPDELLKAMSAYREGNLSHADLVVVQDRAVCDTVREFQAVGSPVVTDGEQAKPSFATYPIAGLRNLSPDGVVIPYADGHHRQLPYLTAGPFRYRTFAYTYLRAAKREARVPVKQAVVAPSALSLLYPPGGIEGYPRDRFLRDLAAQAESDIRGCLAAGASIVQLDFTEARLALKLDPSGGMLRDFVALNNRVLERFSDVERARIGVHTCPGGDHGAPHSLDVDYSALLPHLFGLRVGRFYFQLASEAQPDRVLDAIAAQLPPGAKVFVGVTDPNDLRVEAPEEVCDRVLRATSRIPAGRIGTCDDCGFAPFADDVSMTREIAFAKIRARVEGTALAAKELGI
ncbi:MAG TPA: cobalamin-independent methionine synthase II family protein [Actinocrinis sp.]|uniref:cobalamin-independent methionine synthase II family protein n=1 Tax=Actinocrinis sp. TaxID=1920516 RepID=UPI002DDCA652|nr:cobalamin-independent methionine synthase II family protein [Actinocrinis sp.]HEV2344303.1 cobalamin-independent methionine synthase II family protein [Actinocrinis sp.]